MSQIILLDSDILSEILKGKDAQVQANKNRYTAIVQRLTFTSATVLEILYGLERVDAHAQIKRAEALFEANDEVVLTKEDYRLGAEIAGTMNKRGTFVGLIDPLIAACAIRCGYGVGTGNTDHFEYIRGAGYRFHLENWRKP